MRPPRIGRRRCSPTPRASRKWIVSPAGTTSIRGWASPTTCSATARRRSRSARQVCRRGAHRFCHAVPAVRRRGQQHHAGVDRHQRQLLPGLRPAQPGVERRVRTDGESELRRRPDPHDAGSRLDQGLGQARLQLADIGERRSRALPGDGGQRRLLPDVVRKPDGPRQPAPSRRRTTIRTASRRRPIRAWAASAARSCAASTTSSRPCSAR